MCVCVCVGGGGDRARGSVTGRLSCFSLCSAGGKSERLGRTAASACFAFIQMSLRSLRGGVRCVSTDEDDDGGISLTP